MTGTLYLAWRYLLYNRVKTIILVGSITLILYLPVGLRVLVDQSAQQLTARARATPLVIGAKGSPLELVLNTLYFSEDRPDAGPRSLAEHRSGTAKICHQTAGRTIRVGGGAGCSYR